MERMDGLCGQLGRENEEEKEEEEATVKNIHPCR